MTWLDALIALRARVWKLDDVQRRRVPLNEWLAGRRATVEDKVIDALEREEDAYYKAWKSTGDKLFYRIYRAAYCKLLAVQGGIELN